jgi:opacity protein-like surface antigen
MRKFLLFISLFAFSCLPVSAQDQPKAEIFAGYQYTHLEPSLNASGWNASVAANVTNWFGVKGDFSGAYKSGLRFHTYMFGPVVSARQFGRVTPFAHALFGGARASNGGSVNAFSMAFGGGLDVKINRNVAVRLVQADWLATHFVGDWQKKNARVSAGIVLRF